jgi:hypothetical protein
MEWLGVQRDKLALKTYENRRYRFAAFVFSRSTCRTPSSASSSAGGTRRRTARSECGNVFRYAVVTGRAERDPTVDFRGAIAAVVQRNRPAIVVSDSPAMRWLHMVFAPWRPPVSTNRVGTQI